MDYTALGGEFLIWCLTSNPGRVENHSKGEVQIRLQIHKKNNSDENVQNGWSR